MSLNCLTCQGMKRTDSETDIRESLCQAKPHSDRSLTSFERSWSGNLVPRPNNYDKLRRGTILMAAKKAKKAHHRNYKSGPADFEDTASPRLVRSSGMRRDWSFEDMRKVKGYNKK